MRADCASYKLCLTVRTRWEGGGKWGGHGFKSKNCGSEAMVWAMDVWA